MLDLYNNSTVAKAFESQVVNSETTTAGEIISLAGYEGVVFALGASALTTAGGYWIIQEGDEADLSDAATAPAASVLGAAVIDSDDDDFSAYRMGYVGSKPYVRAAYVSDGDQAGQMWGVAFLLQPHAGATAAQTT